MIVWEIEHDTKDGHALIKAESSEQMIKDLRDSGFSSILKNPEDYIIDFMVNGGYSAHPYLPTSPYIRKSSDLKQIMEKI